MSTITKFAEGLKVHLRSESFVDYLPYTGPATSGGEGCASVDWDALNAEIDAFCAEFKAKQKP